MIPVRGRSGRGTDGPPASCLSRSATRWRAHRASLLLHVRASSSPSGPRGRGGPRPPWAGPHAAAAELALAAAVVVVVAGGVVGAEARARAAAEEAVAAVAPPAQAAVGAVGGGAEEAGSATTTGR